MGLICAMLGGVVGTVMLSEDVRSINSLFVGESMYRQRSTSGFDTFTMGTLDGTR